jgi:hypothetical protein
MKDSAIISGNINIVVAATPYSIEPVSNIAFLFSPGIPVIMKNYTVISNGEDIIIRACMKPICTLINPLDSVNINTKKSHPAAVERSDICVVEAAGVVAESAVAFVLADSFLEKFGGDSLLDIKANYKTYLKRIR